jgi:hypothetical protein
MPGGRERNILRWELRVEIVRAQIARLDDRLVRMIAADASQPAGQRGRRDDLLAQRAELARELESLGPDSRAKMG